MIEDVEVFTEKVNEKIDIMNKFVKITLEDGFHETDNDARFRFILYELTRIESEQAKFIKKVESFIDKFGSAILSPKQEEKEELLSTAQVCDILKISRNTLQKRIEEGCIKMIRHPNAKKIQFTKSEVNRYMKGLQEQN